MARTLLVVEEPLQAGGTKMGLVGHGASCNVARVG